MFVSPGSRAGRGRRNAGAGDELGANALLAQPGTVNLAYFLDQRYGVGGWSQRGTTPHAGTDIGPALDDALDHLTAEFGSLVYQDFPAGIGTVYIPPGMWRMATPPTPSKLLRHRIKGEGLYAATHIVFDNDNAIMFDFDATGEAPSAMGGGLHDLAIVLEEGLGATNSTFIRLTGDATAMPDSAIFQNLNATLLVGGDSWLRGIDIDATARTGPQGIRGLQFRKVNIFASREFGFRMLNGVQAWLEQLGAFVPAAAGGDSIEIGGGGTALTNSIDISMFSTISSDLITTNCSRIYGYGVSCTTHTRNATWDNSRIVGAVVTTSGTPGTNATFVDVL